jgi:hypothetical protein
LQAEGIASRNTRTWISGVFPNVTTTLRIFVSLPASVASGKCTFNVLKQVQNHYRSAVGQDHLTGSATL